MPIKMQKNTGTYPAPVPPGGSGTPPTVVLVTAPATTGYVPHAVIAQGFGTTAGDSAITSYSFNWGDGTAASSSSRSFGSGGGAYAVPVPIAYHRYTVAGTYTLTLTVSDVNGNNVSATRTITVNPLPATTVTVNPGDNVTTALNNAAANAVIRINAGTYTATGAWVPKNGQKVWASGAVTITGNNAVNYFWDGTGVSAVGVIVQGVRITAFKLWALQTAGSLTASSIWKDCEIDHCGTNGTTSGGLQAYHSLSLTVDNCHIHHNVTHNLAGSQGAFTYVIGGEFDHGFTDTSGTINPNAGDGSWKFVHAPASYVVGVNTHDNQGVGTWYDGFNVNVYYCLNTVTDNYGQGFFWEINDATKGGDGGNLSGNLDSSGYSLRVLFNTFTRNGYPAHAPFFPTYDSSPAQVFVSKSDKIEIAYNTIDDGSHALMLNYQGGRLPADAGHNLANISVHDNDIRLRETAPNDDTGISRVGFMDDFTSASYALTNVTFTNNHYFADHDDANWLHFSTYAGTTRTSKTFAQWRAAGYDTAGSGSTLVARASWPH